ncbi:MAG: hypothetical protein FWD53_04075 [Phycisphaerales bacterium]|nr:hypothetical protein [Phycisphaerales bacterium]
MTTLNTQSSWNVGRTSAVCAACQVAILPNAVCWAALCDRLVEQLAPEEKSKKKDRDKEPPSPFLRIDFCEKCWADGKRPVEGEGEMFSFWKTIVPEPQQKKKLLVDDNVLADVFQRMEDKTEPQEIRFRFVLALILMRKRLLKYEGMEPASPDSTIETWRMLPRGTDKPVHVINPHLTADQITEVSQQLSAILAEEI